MEEASCWAPGTGPHVFSRWEGAAPVSSVPPRRLLLPSHPGSQARSLEGARGGSPTPTPRRLWDQQVPGKLAPSVWSLCTARPDSVPVVPQLTSPARPAGARALGLLAGLTSLTSWGRGLHPPSCCQRGRPAVPGRVALSTAAAAGQGRRGSYRVGGSGSGPPGASPYFWAR